jgi:hypothetical protein
MHIGFWWESQKKRGHYEDIDVGGWIILKYRMGCYGLDSSASGEGDQWKVLVKKVMNVRFP